MSEAITIPTQPESLPEHLEPRIAFAARVGVHPRTISRKIEAGELGGVYRIGGRIYVDPVEALASLRVADYVAQPNVPTPVEPPRAAPPPRRSRRSLADYRQAAAPPAPPSSRRRLGGGR